MKQFIFSVIDMEEMQQSSVAIPVISESSQGEYIPSSTEKKRAVMMYLLIGIIAVAFNNSNKSIFEQFHLKQALGWRAVFLLFLIIASLFMFIPLIKYLPLLIILGMLIFLGIFIKRARDGKYSISSENKLAIFAGL